jgi:transcription elongation factor GreA
MAKVKKDGAVLLTAQGLIDVKAELIELKDVKRKEVAQKIKIAIEYGDLSENAEYDEAKNEQALIEARIIQLDQMIKNAQIIKDDKKSNTVKIGCTIIVTSSKAEGESEYSIVGSVEADPLKGKISNESPVGKTLIGKKKGDAVDVKTPSGIITYTIKDIKH